MKKLLTVSVLTAALAASSAFAMGPKGPKGPGADSVSPVKAVYVKSNVFTQQQQKDVASALFKFNNILSDNQGVALKKAVVSQNDDGMWKLVATHKGKAQKISSDDVAMIAKHVNSNAKEMLCASQGMVLQCAFVSNMERNKFVAAKVIQKHGEITIQQIAPKKVLSSKIQKAGHSNLIKIAAKESK